jgi:hypothetical protein
MWLELTRCRHKPRQGVLGTLQPRGGEAKAPELLVGAAPVYPTMARQARVEGQVTIEAVIDTNRKLANMNEKPVPTKTSITVNSRLP